jgi:hypothetical protein
MFLLHTTVARKFLPSASTDVICVEPWTTLGHMFLQDASHLNSPSIHTPTNMAGDCEPTERTSQPSTHLRSFMPMEFSVEHYKLGELSIVEKEHTESHPVPNLGQCSVKHSSRPKFTYRILTDANADNQLRIYLYSARSYGLTSCDRQSPNYESQARENRC